MKRPFSFSPKIRNFSSPSWMARTGSSVGASGSYVPQSQTMTSPPPYSPRGMTPSKSKYSIGWSSTWTRRYPADRRDRGVGPSSASAQLRRARRPSRGGSRSAAALRGDAGRRTARDGRGPTRRLRAARGSRRQAPDGSAASSREVALAAISLERHRSGSGRQARTTHENPLRLATRRRAGLVD